MLTFEDHILGRQFVASRAVRSGDCGQSGSHRLHVLRRSGWHETAQDVHAGGHRFEVVGVDAALDAAEVVYLQPVLDWSLGVFKRQPMGGNGHPSSARRHATVAIVRDSAVPDPTAAERHGDAALEQFVERHREPLQCGH